MDSNDKNKENASPKKDIFMEAARMALVKQSETPVVITETEEAVVVKTQQELALEATNADDWDKLKSALTGRYAKKFMTLMDTLPDREFMRLYPKMLEYVKPKVVRQESRGDEETQRGIRISILQIDDKGNRRVIDVTDGDPDDED